MSFQKNNNKMEEESHQVYCKCRAVFDEDFNYKIIHDVNCPYFYNPSLSEENWLLLRPSRFKQQHTDIEERGEYVPDPIDMDNRNFQEILNEHRRGKLVDRVYQVGHGKNLLKFNFLDRVVKKSLNGGIHFRISRINIVDRATNKIKPSTKMRDLLGSLNKIFQSVIDEAKLEAKKGDQIQLVISTEKTPAYDGDTGMDYPISTPFFSIDDLAGNMIIPFLNRYFKKYEHITVGDNLVVETVLVRAAHNIPIQEQEELLNSGLKEDVLDSLNELKRKKGVIRIFNVDKMCLTRAVVVCFFYNEWGKYKEFNEDGSENIDFKTAQALYDSVRHKDKYSSKQKTYAKLLCDFCQIDSELPTKNVDIEKVAHFLNVEIKIVNFETMKVEQKFGNSDEKFYLLRRKVYTGTNQLDPTFFSKFVYHFDAIICMKTFLRENYFCVYCDVGYKEIQSHKCKDKINSWCNACFRRDCSNILGKYKKCSKCSINTRDSSCFSNHESLNICGFFWCHRCNKRIPKKRKRDNTFLSLVDSIKSHKCEICCNLCGREKGQVHKCYMLRQKFNETCKKLLFFDFETDQSTGVHLPVYCFLQWVEFDDKDKIKVIKEGEKEFGVNYLVFKQVGDFLFSERFRGFTFIAHNMKGFDGFFLLRYLFQEGIFLSTIANGQKLNYINIPSFDIRIIDSLNFLQMRLSDLPSAMGVEDIVKAKGYFPHFFTSPQTLNYVGPMPAPDFFGCFDMKEKGYNSFLKWYREETTKNPIFNFEESMKLYCKQDVKILKAACLKFRETVMDVTEKIEVQPDKLPDEDLVERNRKFNRDNNLLDKNVDDPFEGEIDVKKKSDCLDTEGVCDPFSYLSIPGMCSAIFKAKFLKKNSIAQILPAGYENFKHSLVACEYLEFLKRTKYKHLQYALNTQDGKEIKLGKYRVDGFDPIKKIVFEFYGCFWHGCPTCIKNPFDIHPVKKVSYDSILNDTLEREQNLKKDGYEVQTIWECQWEKMKTNTEVSEVVKNIHVKGRLNPRKGFQGGRTETRLLMYDINNSKHGLGIAYADICSLYPTVNCKEYYPVGHPEIITANFEHFSKYFGLVQCEVLPPQNLTNGVLPCHFNGKLLFPLCRTCAENEQIDICKHSERERVLYGVWTTEELKQAEENNYVVKKVFCIHHFARKSNKLFENYIKTFFKMKLLASKRPCAETCEELDAFIEEMTKFEGIDLRKEDFKFNPGLRCVCKLCCNCFWGRLGMRDSFPNVDFIRNMSDLFKIQGDNTRKISTVRYVSENVVAVLSKNESVDTLNFTNNTNVYLAIFTTSYARMRLYNLIKKVEDRFVYCDTDSVFYEISPNEENNLKTGKFMGDLTSELGDGEYITEFVSGGPKVYAYKTNKNNCIVKIRGFQICRANSAAFSFENIKKVILNYVEKNNDPSINRVRISKTSPDILRSAVFQEVHETTPDKSSAVARDDIISSYNPNRIKRSRNWELLRVAEQKAYTPSLSKRVILNNFYAVPYGYVEK